MRVIAQRTAVWWRLLRLLGDWRSRIALVKGKAAQKLSRGRRDKSQTVPVTVSVPEPHVIWLRPASTDASLIEGYLGTGQNLPEGEIAGEELHQICEFGTNIGIGLVDLALRYPRARLLGVELDPANAGLARRNLGPFRDRCELVEAAVWDEEQELTISRGDHDGLIIAEPVQTTRLKTIRGLRPETLLDRHLPDGPIDFLHLDMVGTEPRILGPDSEWIGRVRSVKIQLYPDRGFSPEQCLHLFDELGFAAYFRHGHHGDYAFAVRTSTLTHIPAMAPALSAEGIS